MIADTDSNAEIFDKNDEQQEEIRKDFLARLRGTTPSPEAIVLARQDYGDDVPDDVLEEIARQQSVARPLLEQFHILHDATPSVAMARATAMREIDAITDVVTAMDLSDLGDVGDFDDEYTCPKCAHRWSGAPNYRTGYGDKVYVPTGRISSRTGRMQSDRYGPPVRTVRDFKYGRNWRGAAAEKLPRGFGNRDIGAPIVGENWRKKSKPPQGS